MHTQTSLLFQPKLSVRSAVEALCWSTNSREANSLCSCSGMTRTCRDMEYSIFTFYACVSTSGSEIKWQINTINLKDSRYIHSYNIQRLTFAPGFSLASRHPNSSRPKLNSCSEKVPNTIIYCINDSKSDPGKKKKKITRPDLWTLG